MRNANPSKIPPTSFFLDSSLFDITKIIPIAANIGENDEGFSILSQMVLPSIPVSESNQDVIVVPTFAPIIIPTA